MESQQNSTTTVTGRSVTATVVTAADKSAKIASPFHRSNMTPDKRSSGSIYCRICHEDGNNEELIDPCECSGTLGLIHASCLEKWLSMSNTDSCEICKYSFVVEKKSKPLSQWWRSRNAYGPQGIAGDVTCLVILTPLCIAATYLCAMGATAYTKLGFWEGTGLAILCAMLIVTYSLWLVVTVRFHFKSWQQWRRKNQDVKLIVKHKSQRPQDPQIKSYSVISQDDNNNHTPPNGNRLATWLLASFANNEDPLYPFQQTTIV